MANFVKIAKKYNAEIEAMYDVRANISKRVGRWIQRNMKEGSYWWDDDDTLVQLYDASFVGFVDFDDCRQCENHEVIIGVRGVNMYSDKGYQGEWRMDALRMADKKDVERIQSEKENAINSAKFKVGDVITNGIEYDTVLRITTKIKKGVCVPSYVVTRKSFIYETLWAETDTTRRLSDDEIATLKNELHGRFKQGERLKIGSTDTWLVKDVMIRGCFDLSERHRGEVQAVYVFESETTGEVDIRDEWEIKYWDIKRI